MATLHPVIATLHPVIATLRPVMATLHAVMATLHAVMATRDPVMATLHPVIATLHPVIANEVKQSMTSDCMDCRATLAATKSALKVRVRYRAGYGKLAMTVSSC